MALKSWSLSSVPFDNLRSSSDEWTASGSGTNEYHYATVKEEPYAVFINGTAATKGTIGSLAAGEWGWGDNDTLGFSTIYVRLSDDADPDGKAEGYVQSTKLSELIDSGANTVIVLSLIIANNSEDDAHIEVERRSSAGATKFKWKLDILATNSPFALDSKIVFTGGDVLVITSNVEDVAVDASGDES